MNDKATSPTNTVEARWGRFRRIVVEPYWCEGSPLLWHAEGGAPGISFFAREGKVGHFNLAWWLLASRTPPQDEKSYRDCPILWVILHAAQLKVGPHQLTEMASWMTQREWEQWLLSYTTARGAAALEAHGVTYPYLLSKISNRA